MTWHGARFPELVAGANTLQRVLRLYLANGSLRAWGALLGHAARRALGRPAPRFITIAPTYRCQCRCVHCYSNAPGQSKEDELTTEEIFSVIDQARRLGVLEVNFSAGEPLLRKDFDDLVQHAHDAGLLTRLNTNGLLLDRERVARLKAAGLTQAGVSIDDPEPEVHDRLRGVPGAHRKAIEGIRNLREAGIPIQIQTYASRRIVTAGLERIIALGRELGVLGVGAFFPIAVGRWDGAFDEVLTEEEKAKVRRLQDLTFVHLELPSPRTLCCLFTRSILYVSPRGEVTPCPFVSQAMGNVRETPLADLWRRHCAALSFQYRGECLMNFPEGRETLRKHIESVAQMCRARRIREDRVACVHAPSRAPGTSTRPTPRT